ncbi:hypothetical protein Syun_009314 [Stephania yunnanensis]|uniref:Uncharacterized protein n=1 Tax=Stephania yunnanensis TaxID=152371 RepID=A0AAP0KGX0_9MAGN
MRYSTRNLVVDVRFDSRMEKIRSLYSSLWRIDFHTTYLLCFFSDCASLSFSIELLFCNKQGGDIVL